MALTLSCVSPLSLSQHCIDIFDIIFTFHLISQLAQNPSREDEYYLLKNLSETPTADTLAFGFILYKLYVRISISFHQAKTCIELLCMEDSTMGTMLSSSSARHRVGVEV